MSNGKDTIIRLIVELIKKTLNEIPLYKNGVNTFQSHLEVLEKILMLKLTFQIMQQ